MCIYVCIYMYVYKKYVKGKIDECTYLCFSSDLFPIILFFHFKTTVLR